ncbi:hypothetical protein GCM10007913_11610 [Devosia yakushimensis]|uniref:Uncharacterized protein n=1 Tax=Devosia yakushimensis TaxID=470028 RepID=A0ABQ5UAU2_9HYPH|nr:hypothetical protein [Devosia yakushimensis]GLQ09229.1 hypothetical protein GCM10007913_11610 [Devosia yakushimensis]
MTPIPHDRIGCLIMGCRRTYKREPDEGEGAEVMCGDHYRLGDKALRQLRTKLKRTARRTGWTPRLGRIDAWLWERIKRQANERAMGL